MAPLVVVPEVPRNHLSFLFILSIHSIFPKFLRKKTFFEQYQLKKVSDNSIQTPNGGTASESKEELHEINNR